jgi:hypothetical protein
LHVEPWQAASVKGRGRVPELERRLEEVHVQYARRIKTLEARAEAAEAAAAAAGAAAAAAAAEAAPEAGAAARGTSPGAGDSGMEEGGGAAGEGSGDVGRPQRGRDSAARPMSGAGSAAAVAKAEASELRRQLALRSQQAAELQQELRVAERQVRQLQRQRHQPPPPPPQQQQPHDAPAAAAAPGAEGEALRAELAAARSALALLQGSHEQLLERCTELGGAQRRASAEARQEAAAREAARWMERVEALEEVRGGSFGNACGLPVHAPAGHTTKPSAGLRSAAPSADTRIHLCGAATPQTCGVTTLHGQGPLHAARAWISDLQGALGAGRPRPRRPRRALA